MKIGIVGTGNISSRHLDEFSNIPNVNVEAVCDTNQKNLEIFLEIIEAPIIFALNGFTSL